jgi:hypothetical protein
MFICVLFTLRHAHLTLNVHLHTLRINNNNNNLTIDMHATTQTTDEAGAVVDKKNGSKKRKATHFEKWSANKSRGGGGDAQLFNKETIAKKRKTTAKNKAKNAKGGARDIRGRGGGGGGGGGGRGGRGGRR